MENWHDVAATYRDSFASLCAGSIDAVLGRLEPGRLLDVGCGTGDLAVSAQRRGHEVTAVDAAAPMVAMTAERIGAGQSVQASLPALPFPDGTFDAVTANFVLNHVPDPRAAVRELARVAAPAGRVVLTIWPAGGAGWSALVGEALAAAEAVPLVGARLPEHLDFPRTAAGLADLATDGDLKVVESGQIEWTWRVRPRSLWAGISGGVATIGQTYLAQTPSVQARIEQELARRSQAAADDGWLVLPCRAVLTVAQR